jgi:SpoVK/Ycf46/Vps4 family AAA+-type ATPase
VLVTCNRMDVFPPELLRRFKFGVVYFDLPTSEELGELWSIYAKKYGVKQKGVTVDDTGWTGSEVRNCCEIARDLSITLEEAAKLIVPIVKSDPASISKMRQQANGRYLSASYSGTYSTNKARELPKF